MTRRDFLKGIAVSSLVVCGQMLPKVDAEAAGETKVIAITEKMESQLNRMETIYRADESVVRVIRENNKITVGYADGTTEALEFCGEQFGYVRGKDGVVHTFYKTDSKVFVDEVCVCETERLATSEGQETRAFPNDGWTYMRYYTKTVTVWTQAAGAISISALLGLLGFPYLASTVLSALLSGATVTQPKGYFRCYEYKMDNLYIYKSRCYVYRDSSLTDYLGIYDTATYEEIDRP